MCYCISTPRHYTHYTDEETEVQRGEGTFLNFYCTGLFDYYLHGGGQQVRHIQSLPWFWLIGLLQTVCTSPVLPSASGDVAALWLTRALPSGLPSACGLRRGPGLHPHAPPSCLSSKKCGSLITACVISPGMGCGPLLAADRKRQKPQSKQGLAPLHRRGKRQSLWLRAPETTPSHTSDPAGPHVQSGMWVWRLRVGLFWTESGGGHFLPSSHPILCALTPLLTSP